MVPGVEPISSERLERLWELVSDRNSKTELECGEHLHHAADLLTGGTPRLVLPVTLEERSFFGRTDFIVRAIMRTDTGTDIPCVYFWELKAPQCFVLEPDDAPHRYRATPDLVRAETQLLHYYAQALDDRHFSRRYEVDPKDIKLGGILIGARPDRFAKRAQTPEEIKAANYSFALRTHYLYEPRNLRVMTWDRVIMHLRGFESPPAKTGAL